MKTLHFISTLVVLGLATVVTAGSLYVTASAAAQQESTDFDPAATDAAEVPAAPITVVDAVSSSLDKSRILNSSQSHVILDENGGFSGRLSSLRSSDGEPIPAAGLSVRLAQHGTIIGSTTTDANGRFSFTDLPQGVVAIMAEGQNSLMVFGFVLFGHDASFSEKAPQLELDMDSAVASGADVATARELIAGMNDPGPEKFSGDITAAEQEPPFDSGELSVTLKNRRVRLQNDGTLRGEVGLLDERTGRLREVLDLTVHFVRNGVRVASAVVSSDGGFIANGLTPGVHSVVIVGPDGASVCNVDIVGTTYEENAVQGASNGEFTPVSIVEASLNLFQNGGFGGSPASPANVAALSGGSGGSGQGGGAGTGAPVAGSGFPPGGGGGGFPGGGGFSGGGGGFSGGGGGFGGGGGWGALLAGGIGGAVGYLAGENRNDDPSSP